MYVFAVDVGNFLLESSKQSSIWVPEKQHPKLSQSIEQMKLLRLLEREVVWWL